MEKHTCFKTEELSELNREIQYIFEKLNFKSDIEIEKEIERRSIIEAERIRKSDSRRAKVQIFLSILIIIFFIAIIWQNSVSNKKTHELLQNTGVPVGYTRGNNKTVIPFPPDVRVILYPNDLDTIKKKK
jgi:hypothetical protein